MPSYDTNDWVEKAFDVYEIDADADHTITDDPDRAYAKLFIEIIAPIIRRRIQNIKRP